MKIGIIGDTHIPALSPLLPARIRELFKGLDIILHVGDICELYVLQEFQETYTLTFAVSGEEDSEAVRHYLDEKRVVKFGERRVGMIHGHQVEEQYRKAMSGLRRWLGHKPEPVSWPSLMLGEFEEEEVDAIVFGHTHQPYVKMHGPVLFFNPGSALPGPDRHPSVGILDIGKRNITGKIVYL
jgi:putative phosphoesterase